MKKRTWTIIGILVACGAFMAEEIARQQLSRRYQASLEIRKQLELQIGGLRAQVVSERQQVEELSETLAAKNDQLEEAILRLTEEDRLIQELQTRLLAMQQQLDLLQGEMALVLETRPPQASGSHAGEPVQLEKIVVTSPQATAFQGRIVSINQEWNFVVVDLGWDVVKIGDVVSIYRNDQFLAKARIERAQEHVSAATILPDWTHAQIEINDMVRAL